jgi:2-methylcitrate dehydratase PrpD
VTSYTRVLSEFSCAVTADAIPAPALDATRRLILDTIGCAVGGTGVPSSGIVARVRAAGPPQATLIVDGARVSLLSAVHVNAHRANALDAEETIRHSGHLAAATVPAALAVAEYVGSSGAELAAAVCVGFDVAARIALSLRTLDTTPDGLTVISPVAGSSWAAFAATVAAGRLLGLSPEAMANAFGITVASAPMPIAGRWGVQASPRPMTKYGLYGAIAEAGVAAALLADAGMDGDTEVLDGDNGFWRMNGSRSCDWDALVDGLGHRWLVAETSYKLFPACQYAMPALDLIYRIMAQEDVAAQDIDAVDVLVPTAAITKHMADRSVRTVVDGQFSIPHLVALALRGGAPGPRWHTAAALADASVRDFAARVRVGVYDRAGPILSDLMARQGHAHLIPTKVIVHAAGRQITRASNTGEHDWHDHTAAHEDGALRAKFRRFCEPYLAPDAIETAAGLIDGIAAAPSVRPLVAALVATDAAESVVQAESGAGASAGRTA